MPIELLDLGFSVLKFPFASLAAGLGLGLGVWARRALPGVVGVEIDAVTDAFALGGVDVKAALAAVETVRLAGVDPAVVVVLSGSVIVTTCDELLCVLTWRAFPIIPWTQASLSGLGPAGEPKVAALVLAFLMPPFGPAAPSGV